MKAFQFRLQSVMEWREAILEKELLKLQALLEESRVLASRLEGIHRDMSLHVEEATSGAELAAFGRYRDRLRREMQEVREKQRLCLQRLQLQREAFALANRNLKLLERLKEKRKEDWKREFDRELETLAGEAFLARWERNP
jgi:hypothetical protein